MRVRQGGLGRVGVAGSLLAIAGFAGMLPHGGASAADADVFATKARVAVSPGSAPLSTTSYAITATTNPVSVCYADLAGAQTGGCNDLSGSGSVDTVDCVPSGFMSATWSLTEPGPDTASFVGSGVLVGNVAVLAATAGYSDPSTTSTPGPAVAVAVLLPLTVPDCSSTTTWGGVASVVGSAP